MFTFLSLKSIRSLSFHLSLYFSSMTTTNIDDKRDYSHIKLVASDLDGTLTVHGINGYTGTMSERTIQALQALEAKGVTIIMASGRPPRSMIPMVSQAKLQRPLVVSCNGGTVLDYHTQTVIRKYSIPPEAVRELIREVKAHFGPKDILIGGESGKNFRCEEAYAQQRFNWVGKIYNRVDDLDQLANETDTIEKLMLLHRVWPADQLFDYLEKHVLTDPKWKSLIHYTFSSPNFVEVSAPGVCKATAIEDLCKAAGIKASEVIAFGDMPNDLEMLEFAGIGVAVGNAHQKVKDVAGK